MVYARPIRERPEFRSNPQKNQAITNSSAIRPNSPLCVFNNFHTPAPLNFELSPVFPSDYALPHKKGGGTPPSNTEVRQSPMPSYKSFIVNRLSNIGGGGDIEFSPESGRCGLNLRRRYKMNALAASSPLETISVACP